MPRTGGVKASLVALLGSATALTGQQAGAGAFVHESWTIQDGLPLNSIRQVLQGHDGYIWIATLDGLVRFDGVRFTVYNSANSPDLPTNRIVRLYETRDSTLWLQTERAELVRFRRGKFLHIDPAHGLETSITLLYEDAEGVAWVGTPHGLGRMNG